MRESFLSDRRWFLDEQLAGGGIMLSGGVHDFEVLRMLLGEPRDVYAVRVRQRVDEMRGDDTSLAVVRFPNGAAATLVESCLMKSLVTAAGREEHTLRIDGDLGSVRIDFRERRARMFGEHADWQQTSAVLADHDPRVHQSDPIGREIAPCRGVEWSGVECAPAAARSLSPALGPSAARGSWRSLPTSRGRPAR